MTDLQSQLSKPATAKGVTMSTKPAVYTTYYRGIQITMTSTDSGWTLRIGGRPVLFDLIFLDFSPAFALVDMFVAMGRLPSKSLENWRT